MKLAAIYNAPTIHANHWLEIPENVMNALFDINGRELNIRKIEEDRKLEDPLKVELKVNRVIDFDDAAKIRVISFRGCPFCVFYTDSYVETIFVSDTDMLALAREYVRQFIIVNEYDYIILDAGVEDERVAKLNSDVTLAIPGNDGVLRITCDSDYLHAPEDENGQSKMTYILDSERQNIFNGMARNMPAKDDAMGIREKMCAYYNEALLIPDEDKFILNHLMTDITTIFPSVKPQNSSDLAAVAFRLNGHTYIILVSIGTGRAWWAYESTFVCLGDENIFDALKNFNVSNPL